MKELRELWKEPEKRIECLKDKDPTFQAELDGVLDEGQETTSQYSLASFRSQQSYLSTTSSVARSLSGTSTVSVLSKSSSHLSTASGASLVSSTSMASGTSSSSFAVEGLEHSLLSRGGLEKSGTSTGSVSGGGSSSLPSSDRKMKKRGKGKGKGSSDTASIEKEKRKRSEDQILFREKKLCCEIWGILVPLYQFLTGNWVDLVDAFWGISSLASSPSTSSTTLSSVVESSFVEWQPEIQDRNRLVALQAVLDDGMRVLQSIEVPLAPRYPPIWMQHKGLKIFRKYQVVETLPEDSTHALWNEMKASSRGLQQSPEVLELMNECIEKWIELRRVSLVE